MSTTRRAFLRRSFCLGAAATLSIKEISALSSSLLESKSLSNGIPSVASPVGRALSRKPFPELKASGSPGAIGLAHGKTFAAKVRHNVGFYLDYLSKRTQSENKDVLARAHGFRKEVQSSFASPLVSPGSLEGVSMNPPRAHESPNPSLFRARAVVWMEE